MRNFSGLLLSHIIHVNRVMDHFSSHIYSMYWRDLIAFILQGRQIRVVFDLTVRGYVRAFCCRVVHMTFSPVRYVLTSCQHIPHSLHYMGHIFKSTQPIFTFTVYLNWLLIDCWREKQNRQIGDSQCVVFVVNYNWSQKMFWWWPNGSPPPPRPFHTISFRSVWIGHADFWIASCLQSW